MQFNFVNFLAKVHLTSWLRLHYLLSADNLFEALFDNYECS